MPQGQERKKKKRTMQNEPIQAIRQAENHNIEKATQNTAHVHNESVPSSYMAKNLTTKKSTTKYTGEAAHDQKKSRKELHPQTSLIARSKAGVSSMQNIRPHKAKKKNKTPKGKERKKETEVNRRSSRKRIIKKVIAGDVDVNHKSLLHETSAIRGGGLGPDNFKRVQPEKDVHQGSGPII